ncbi:Dipeptidyl peptidase 4 [Cryptotrichosporon argae]
MAYDPVGASSRGPRGASLDGVVRASLDSDGSDLVYRDHLEDEPFDKEDTRFDADARMEDGDDEQGYVVEPNRLRPRRKSRGIFVVLVGVIGFAAAIGLLAAGGYSVPSFVAKSGNRHMTLDHVFNGTFNARSQSIDWVREAEDGTYSRIDEHGNIVLATVSNPNTTRVLVDTSVVIDDQGARLQWLGWRLSADMDYVLFRTDYVQQWRHSSHANYWVHRRADNATFALVAPSKPPKVSKVTWAPVGHALAYVVDNDLYVLAEPETAAVRVTTDGSATVFNGVPDWVYEEEVFSTDSAMWWSPDGNTLAYLRADETHVRQYRLQYYNPTPDAFAVNQYTTELDMRYPKPGTPNPLVTVHTFDLAAYKRGMPVAHAKQTLAWAGEMDSEARIIVEVGWVADDGLLVKEIDRAARVGHVVVFEGGKAEGTVVRKLGAGGEEGDDGWIDHGQDVIPVPGDVPGYLDIVSNDGYDHVAYFSPINATEPLWLTSGEWEVTKLAGINAAARTIYFVAAAPSIDRHVYSVTLPADGADTTGFAPKLSALTDATVAGYHDVQFSPGAGYYVLSYRGPDVPWQRLRGTADDVDELLEGNAQLNRTLSEFLRPIVTRTTIVSDGYELNMLEILPPNMDTSGRKKYPVLVRVYGGPGSQMVSNQYSRDWHAYLACEHKYIVVMVDGRGTGFKGRQLRNPVRDELGRWEVEDQVAAAREMVQRKYVDRSRIGIWGWSYGGYMTLKTLEAQSGVFTLGMAVAPVTNWMLYDSVYTERYMDTPAANPDGYVASAVNNVSAFDGVDLALAHGSGDDNVHYAHMASLLDKFTQRHVRGWRFRMFTDSNHSMDKREAYREVYQWLTDFLVEKWGRGGTVHH